MKHVVAQNWSSLQLSWPSHAGYSAGCGVHGDDDETLRGHVLDSNDWNNKIDNWLRCLGPCVLSPEQNKCVTTA